MAAAKKTIAVTGSTGLVGEAVVAALEARGDRVVRLSRHGAKPGASDAVAWDPARGTIDASGLSGVHAVVHLAGESIASGRWTDTQKERIRASRVDGTRLLAGALAGLSPKPAVFVSTSAIGIYGDRGDEVLDDESPPGTGFLTDVCVAWEAAADPARAAGIRVVHPRLGLVLAPHGGALAKMLPLFRAGGGGRLGSGKQWWSFVSLEDLVRFYLFVLDHDSLDGPVAAVAPHPITNASFTATLARVLRRPAVIPAPAFALRLAMGEMADALLLASQRVVPRRLSDAGFEHRHPELEVALRAML